MSAHQTDRNHFERQILFARPIFVLLALLAAFEQPASRQERRSVSFLIAYLIVSLVITQVERLLRNRSWHLPLACDLLALGYFMFISPSSVPVWFPYMFICYAAGIRWGFELTVPLAGVLSLTLVLLTAVKGEIHWMRVVAWLGLTAATFAGGAGLAFLGDRNKRFASQIEFFSRINATMQVDQGSGFGWDRRDGRPIKNLPRLPGPVLLEFRIRSLLTVSFDQSGKPTGRIFLLNGPKPFQKQDLVWLESIAQHIGPALENIFLLRHLRARAIEAEHSRIARDLHDGILQTLLSIEIQLDVLRRKVPAAGTDQAVNALANLQQTVRNEAADLRQTVTDLRKSTRL